VCVEITKRVVPFGEIAEIAEIELRDRVFAFLYRFVVLALGLGEGVWLSPFPDGVSTLGLHDGLLTLRPR
jgi:hypothetical protein